MIELLLLVSLPEAPSQARKPPLCDGIALIEKSTLDRPLAFKSLVVREMVPQQVRDKQGKRVTQKVEVVKVRPLPGLFDCRFVYNYTISLACYGPAEIAEGDMDAREAGLSGFAKEIRDCLTNDKLTQSSSDPDSTPFIAFSGGAKQPFYQISMVPFPAKDAMLRPELLVLGPVIDPIPPKSRSSTAKPEKVRAKSKK
ncbi:hypothetical protein [Candidatus Phycosocius spiralis]|uniref:Uncharacterized protein n=1 Tax=Candidatus Phycosocius spiralis TaxID=2815099 RepID=A0ABQ4PS99_9PROT|nr:hypothetical protein [Candidatus Phycosocius spiralis]GIU65882.1 hypothetical protein PsB1_0036 [Candidatus Phycosocius spiralis]